MLEVLRRVDHHHFFTSLSSQRFVHRRVPRAVEGASGGKASRAQKRIAYTDQQGGASKDERVDVRVRRKQQTPPWSVVWVGDGAGKGLGYVCPTYVREQLFCRRFAVNCRDTGAPSRVDEAGLLTLFLSAPFLPPSSKVHPANRYRRS